MLWVNKAQVVETLGTAVKQWALTLTKAGNLCKTEDEIWWVGRCNSLATLKCHLGLQFTKILKCSLRPFWPVDMSFGQQNFGESMSFKKSCTFQFTAVPTGFYCIILEVKTVFLLITGRYIVVKHTDLEDRLHCSKSWFYHLVGLQP